MSLLRVSLLAIVLGMSSHVIASDLPNVLFIAIDDLNDWVGPLGGHPQVQTPHLDALAARGVNFTNAHCQAPLCNPSRTSLLFSRRPSSTGVYSLDAYFRDAPELKDSPTVLQHFARNGYETYSVGKIFHNGWFLLKNGTYDDEANHHGPAQTSKPMADPKLSGTHPIDGQIVDWGVHGEKMSERGDWATVEWTIKRLKEHDTDSPFFMASGLYLPHVPIYTTQRWHDLYPLDTVQLPEIRDRDRDDTSPFAWYLTHADPYPKTDWLRENNQLKPLVQSYLAAVSYVDHEVGRILAALDEIGERENTVVVLFSDHGFHCGEKGVSGKHTLWEESTRVPLIFAGPNIAKGESSGEAVELLDIYPTLAAACGLPAPENVEGLSLMPQLRDPSTRRDQPAICTASPDCHSVRDERWRFIEYADGSRELYDCLADPGEFHNLIDDVSKAAVVEELARWLPKVNAEPLPGSSAKMVTQRDGAWYYEETRIAPVAPPQNP